MTSALNTPVRVLTRDIIVDTLSQHLKDRIVSDKNIRNAEKSLLRLSSEPNRYEDSDRRKMITDDVDRIDGYINEKDVFLEFLKNTRHSSMKALSPGNYLVVEIDGKTEAWLVYDDQAIASKHRSVFAIDSPNLLGNFGVDEFKMMSVKCPVISRIQDNDIRVGAFITVNVDGNETVSFQVCQIL